jgi:hypothetical protein
MDGFLLIRRAADRELEATICLQGGLLILPHDFIHLGDE